MSKPSTPVPRPLSGRLTPSRSRILVDGEPVEYVESGRGPVLLLLHGHEQDATSWRRVMPALATDRRVIALTLPGYGETPPPAGGYSGGRDLARSVRDFLDELGIGAVDLVGHSVGGAVALHLALADPSQVRTLTLVASAGLGREVNPLIAFGTLPGVGELAVRLSRLPGGHVQRTILSVAMLFGRPWRVPLGFLREADAVGRRPGQLEASTALSRALFDVTGQREILLDELHALTMPSLVVWGEWDLVLPAHHARAAARRLPRARVALFPACGHLPHVEQPDRFIAELRTLLSQPLHHRHDAA